jgi:hypothetical protein
MGNGVMAIGPKLRRPSSTLPDRPSVQPWWSGLDQAWETEKTWYEEALQLAQTAFSCAGPSDYAR